MKNLICALGIGLLMSSQFASANCLVASSSDIPNDVIKALSNKGYTVVPSLDGLELYLPPTDNDGPVRFRSTQKDSPSYVVDYSEEHIDRTFFIEVKKYVTFDKVNEGSLWSGKKSHFSKFLTDCEGTNE